MKINHDKIYVKNKFGRMYLPEFIYLFPSSLSDGWYIGINRADSVETKVLDSVRHEIVTGNLTTEALADVILNRDVSNTKIVRLPKMTKAQSVAIEGMGITFMLVDNQWEIAGYGLHKNILSSLKREESFTISPGILQPLFTGATYNILPSKDGKWIVFIEGQEYFICGTMEAQ